MAKSPQLPSKNTFPSCSICNQPVELRTAKTDADGQAIHEDCYVLQMKMQMRLLSRNPSD